MSKFVMGRRAIAWVQQQRKKQVLNGLPLVVAIALLGGWAWRQMPDYDDPETAKAGVPQSPGQSETYDAVEVLDGDTLKLPNGERVRLCGIDAPEVAKGNNPGQPLGEAAKGWLRSRIAAAGGRVIVSPVERDRYGRLVAEVFVSARNPQQPEEEKLLNDELVRAGMAYHYRQYSQGCPMGAVMLDAAEAEAKGRRLGVWIQPQETPWEFRKAQRSGN
jgi:micrococcal nuclease